jgi:hypothetical protein
MTVPLETNAKSPTIRQSPSPQNVMPAKAGIHALPTAPRLLTTNEPKKAVLF